MNVDGYGPDMTEAQARAVVAHAVTMAPGDDLVIAAARFLGEVDDLRAIRDRADTIERSATHSGEDSIRAAAHYIRHGARASPTSPADEGAPPG